MTVVVHDPLVATEAEAELAVHALAQLPPGVRARIPRVRAAEVAALSAAAYGVGDRIDWVAPGAAATGRPRTLAEMLDGVEGDTEHERDDDGILAGQRLVVVTNIPTHYRVALFSEMRLQAERAGAALHVLFLSGTPRARSWMTPGELAFDHSFLDGVDLARGDGRRIVPLDLERAVRRLRPGVLLAGGFSPLVAGRVALLARILGRSFGIWSGEIRSRPTARSRARTLQRRLLLRRAAFGVAYGSRAAAYLRSLRVDLPLVLGRNATVLPERSGLSGRACVELVSVARLEPEKALEVLVGAVRSRPELDCRLTFVGDGPMRGPLEQLAAGDPRFRFLGALTPPEARSVVSASDAFLFPSRYDVFGLALVEAMGAGLATLVSHHPGAVDDLCADGRNCLLVADDVESWAGAIERVVRDERLRSRLATAAWSTVSARWTIAHAARAMLDGFRLGVLAGAGR